MTVGERIKELRIKLDMSQVDFADKINVSKQTLYKYENNIITNIPSDKIEAVAKIGNVSPAYLMGWSDTANAIGNHNLYIEIEASSKNEAIYVAVKNMLIANGNIEKANLLSEAEAVKLYNSSGFNIIETIQKQPTTLAAHFDGEEFTEDELDEIRQFAEFVKNKRK